MRHGSLFSGIGGFELASQWMGWENVFHCEINEFGKKVLNYYWPKSISYEDIKTTDFTIHRGTIDILTGGFPCQPYSAAGKRLGKEDERHLWPEMLRAIREIQPTWVVGENVSGLVNWNGGMVFNEVQTDLEAEGYEVTPFLLPACGVNAPHKRERVWFVAHNTMRIRPQEIDKRKEHIKDNRNGFWIEPGADGIESVTPDTTGNAIPGQNGESSKVKKEGVTVNEPIRGGQFKTIQSEGLDDLSRPASDTKGSSSEGKLLKRQGEGESGGCNSKVTSDTDKIRFSGKGESAKLGWIGFSKSNTQNNIPTQSPLCDRNDGISSKLSGITFPKWRNESIKAMGNAIVPQVVLQIFKAIENYERQEP